MSAPTGTDSARTGAQSFVVGEGDSAIVINQVEPSLSEASDDVQRLVDAVVQIFGEDDAFIAVVTALGRGYDIGGVEMAINAGALVADGTIPSLRPTRMESTYLLIEKAAGLRRGFRGSTVDAPVEPEPETTIGRAIFIGEEDGLVGASFLQRARDSRAGVADVDAVDSGKQLIYLIIAIAQSGYSMDQIIESLLLESTGVTETSSGCAALSVGFEIVRPAYSDIGGCSGMVTGLVNSQEQFASENSSSGESDDDAQSDSGQSAEPSEGTGFEPGRFTGSAIGLLGEQEGDSDGDTTVLLRDSAEVEVGSESMSGSVELVVQATSTCDDEEDLCDLVDDTICVSIVIGFDDVPLTDVAAGRFEGSATADGNFEFGNCPSGGLPSLQTLPASVTAHVDGETLDISVTTDEETISLVLTRE